MKPVIRNFIGTLTNAVGWTGILLMGLILFERDLLPAREGLAVTDEERGAILATLRSFNAIWSDFYASGGDPSLIDAFPAVKVIKHGVFRDMGFLRDRGRIQVYDLAKMVPVEVKLVGPDRAEALVYEEWNYVIQDRATRAPVTDTAGMGQGFRYRLERVSGRWMVYAWDPEDLPPPPREGFMW